MKEGEGKIEKGEEDGAAASSAKKNGSATPGGATSRSGDRAFSFHRVLDHAKSEERSHRRLHFQT